MTKKITSMFSRLAAPFLKPTLALLAALAVGGVIGATYTTTWLQDFESSDYNDNWTAKVAIDDELNTLLKTLKSSTDDQLNNANNGTGLSQNTRTLMNNESSSYIRVNTNGRESNLGSGSAKYVFPSNFSSANLSEYQFEYDFFLVPGTGATRSCYFCLRGENGIIAVIEVKQNNSTAILYKLSNGALVQAGTFTINGRGTASSTGSNWYHAEISATQEDGVKITLTLQGAASPALSAVYLGGFDNLASIYTYQTTDNANFHVDWGFDNFVLKTPAVEGQNLVWSADNADNTDWTAVGAWTAEGVSGKTFANGDDVTFSASSFGESEAAKTIAVSTTVAPLSFTADIPENKTVTIGGEGKVVNADASFVKSGAGTLVLGTEGNEFNDVTVEAGTLTLTANALSYYLIANNGTVNVDSGANTVNIGTISGNGTTKVTSGTLNVNGAISGTVVNNGTLTFAVNQTGLTSVSGVGRINVSGTTWTVTSGPSTTAGYSGDIYVSNNGRLRMAENDYASGARFGTGAIHLDGGTIDTNNGNNGAHGQRTISNDIAIGTGDNVVQNNMSAYNNSKLEVSGALSGTGTIKFVDSTAGSNQGSKGIYLSGNNGNFEGTVTFETKWGGDYGALADKSTFSGLANAGASSSNAIWNVTEGSKSIGFNGTGPFYLGAFNVPTATTKISPSAEGTTFEIGNKANSSVNGEFTKAATITKVGASTTLTLGSGFTMPSGSSIAVNAGKVIADCDTMVFASVSLTAVGTSLDVLKTVTLSDASKITQPLGDGYDIQFSEGETYNTYTLVEVSSVAEVDGQPYATLQAAADAAAEGATITMTGSTTDGVSLKRGQVLVVGDNSCGTVSGATQYISVSYNETTKSWTAVETATWNGGAGNWNLASNWNTGVVPSRYTEVVISNAGDDYINVYLTAGAECKAMNISGKVYFSQENAATTVHNAIAMYGNITGTGTIKLVHTGFANSSGAAITIAPDLLVADPGADSDSWISGGNITMSGCVTVERKFVIWGTNNTFSGSLIFSSNAHLGCWGDGVKGLVFNNVSITSGEGANIWLGADKSQSSISGTGCTLSGSLRINTDNGTTISAPVTLNNNASLVVTDGGTISSVAAANATYLVADSTAGGLKTYTANAAPLVVNNVGYSTLANAWNAAGNGNNAAWIYVYSSLPQEDTVTMTASWQKLRVVPGEYSIDGHVLLASTLANVALKKDVGAEMTEYTAYPTVKVTVTPGAGVASGTIADESSYIEKNDNVYTVYSGAQVTITWTAAEGYEFAGGQSTDTTVISPTESVTPECPAATAVVVGSVSIAAPVVGAYGNDFATVSVTAGVTSTYPAATTITYTLKANGTTIATTTAAGDATSVTFDNANVSSLKRYGNISYTVEASGDNVTAATSGATTAMLADAEGWVDEKKSTTGTTGSWKNAVTYGDDDRVQLSDNKFSATNCSTGDVVTVTIKDVIYTALSDTSTVDGDAQGSVALGGTEFAPKFMVLTKSGNEVQWSEAAGVNPSLNTSYTIVFTFDYNSNKYSITVNEAALTVGGSATYDIVKTTNKYVKDIDFLGAGSIKAIEGIQYDAMMAVDQDGVRYATVAEALDANKGVKGAIIKLLHGTSNTSIAGWRFDEATRSFIKKAMGMVFLAF